MWGKYLRFMLVIIKSIYCFKIVNLLKMDIDIRRGKYDGKVKKFFLVSFKMLVFN